MGKKTKEKKNQKIGVPIKIACNKNWRNISRPLPRPEA